MSEESVEEKDPFSLVYDSLWEMALRSQVIRDFVRQGNRIKYDGPQAPKQVLSEGDLPELALISSGGSSNIMNSSSTSKVTRDYTWVLATGEYNINAFYNKLSFALYRAMVGWDEVLCSLTWRDYNFVVQATTIDIDDGVMLKSVTRNINGWAALWGVTIDMHFSTEALRLD